MLLLWFYSQIYCDGPMLHAIQMAKLFPDGKTFVDMSLKDNPGKTLVFSYVRSHHIYFASSLFHDNIVY